MTLSSGKEVPFSMSYKGTTYLPLGKLAELFDKNAVYDGANNAAVITSKAVPLPEPTGSPTTLTGVLLWVGEHLPAGRYMVTPARGSSGLISFTATDRNGRSVVSETLSLTSSLGVDIVIITLSEGTLMSVVGGSLVFTPVD